MENHKIESVLNSVGRKTEQIIFADGSHLLVLPDSGRVLGLYAPDSGVNFFWTNPALENKRTAASFFKAEGWRNPGGDRTWLAPEAEIFVGDMTNPMDSYQVPKELDPGSWHIESPSPSLRLVNETTIKMIRSKKKVQVKIAKEFRPAPNPLRSLNIKQLQYSGYEQVTTLDLDVVPEASCPIRLGLWNLIQLPKPGRMLIPTYSMTKPIVFFGIVDPDELKITRNMVSWSMNHGNENSKIAIKAEALTGRAGYLYRSPDPHADWNLVVRQFTVNPSGEYVDALWNNPSDNGYAFQACSVNTATASFNELEYHVPAVETSRGRNHYMDRSQAWAFRGKLESIAEASMILLGAKI